MHLYLTDQKRLTLSEKAYKVLRPGKIYSDDGREITITPEMIIQLKDNFDKGVLQIVPFIDELHRREKSFGDVTGCVIDNGELSLQIAWNDCGKETISRGEYQYLSVDVGEHIDSKTGQKFWPVLFGAALTNTPVYKEQEKVTLSEATAGKGQTNTGGNMDKIKEILDMLVQALAGIGDAEKETAKAEISKALGIEMACGTKEEKMSDDPKLLQLSEALKTQVMQLSESMKTLQSENAELKKSQKLTEFGKYIGTKITAAAADKWQRLFLSDEAGTKELLDAMPDLNHTVELGSDGKAPVKLSEKDRAIMLNTGYNPDKPEDVARFMEAVR